MLCSLPSSVEREQLAHVLCCCFLLGLLLVITGLREAGSVKCTGDQLRSTIWSVASGLISRYSSLEGGSFKVARECPSWGWGRFVSTGELTEILLPLPQGVLRLKAHATTSLARPTFFHLYVRFLMNSLNRTIFGDVADAFLGRK